VWVWRLVIGADVNYRDDAVVGGKVGLDLVLVADTCILEIK
jgi:hypothetical protein